MEWWNVGTMEYWKKTRVTSERVQNPLMEYSNHPLLFVYCRPIIPIFHFPIIPELF
jgi:hypothetical protein